MKKHIIIDVAKAEVDQMLLGNFQKMGLTVQTGKELTLRMLKSFCQVFESLDPNKTLLVFPGNGANIVKRYLSVDWLSQWKSFSVVAKRVWRPGEDPQVFLGRVSNKMILGIKQVVIVDDVVSSGATIRGIQKLNEPWIPGASWNALAWIVQTKTSARNFQKVIGYRVGEKNRFVPINSLSTLLENKEILRSYAQRNFDKPQDFIDLIEGIE